MKKNNKTTYNLTTATSPSAI